MSRRVDQLIIAGVLYNHPSEVLTWPECLEVARTIQDALATAAVLEKAREVEAWERGS